MGTTKPAATSAAGWVTVLVFVRPSAEAPRIRKARAITPVITAAPIKAVLRSIGSPLSLAQLSLGVGQFGGSLIQLNLKLLNIDLILIVGLLPLTIVDGCPL